MISSCPHCRLALKFNEAQLAKLQQALNTLEPDKRLTIKCPQCKKAIQLGAKEYIVKTANLNQWNQIVTTFSQFLDPYPLTSSTLMT